MFSLRNIPRVPKGVAPRLNQFNYSLWFFTALCTRAACRCPRTLGRCFECCPPRLKCMALTGAGIHDQHVPGHAAVLFLHTLPPLGAACCVSPSRDGPNTRRVRQGDKNRGSMSCSWLFLCEKKKTLSQVQPIEETNTQVTFVKRNQRTTSKSTTHISETPVDWRSHSGRAT